MNEWMKLSAAAALLVAFGSFAACSDATGPDFSKGGPDSSVGGGDSGPGEDDSGTPGTCTFPTETKTGTEACDQCMAQNCCSKAVACVELPACLDLIACTTNCIDGKQRDGGVFDAEADDAGLVDKCWEDCTENAATGGDNLFEALDVCSETKCKAQCNPETP